MADQTGIDAFLSGKAQAIRRATHEQAVRHLLATLDPQHGDHALAYQDVLQRLEEAIAKERQGLGG